MRKCLGLLVLVALALTGVPGRSQEPAGKPRIAVLALKGEGRGTFGNQQDAMYQKVTEAFFATRRFEMMERNQLSAVLGEATFQNSGLADDATAAKLGSQINAKFIVLGSFTGSMDRLMETFQGRYGPTTTTTYPAKVTLSLRMVNVETGRLEETFEATGAGKANNPTTSMNEMMRDLSVKLGREVANKFPLSGYLIKVLSDREALIDLGKKDGVAPGDVFLLVERGPDIVHPVTGRIIKGKKTILTELKVSEVDDETSTVRVSGSKVPLKVGLTLESQPRKAGFWESLGDAIKK